MGRPSRSKAAALAPDVPTSTATRTSPPRSADRRLDVGMCLLSPDQLVAGDLVAVEGHERPQKRTGRVVAAWIYDHRPAEPADAGRFVDVAVKAEHRLAFQLELADGAAPDSGELDLAKDCLHPQVRVELRRLIELGPEWRNVYVEHASLRPA